MGKLKLHRAILGHPGRCILLENVLSTPLTLLLMIHSVNQFEWKKQVVKIYLSYHLVSLYPHIRKLSNKFIASYPQILLPDSDRISLPT